jgi:ADP-ribose pyrophosphatase
LSPADPPGADVPPSPAGPLAIREVFRGSLLKVDVETWPVGVREVVRHPGACAVVALTPEGDVLLVRQFRQAVRQELIEIPAGIFDVEGEDAAGCAVRELLEETGYRVTELERLGTIHSSPGFTDERLELFVAQAEPEGEPSEHGVEMLRMPFAAAVSAAEDGRITDAKSVAGLLLAKARLIHGRLDRPGSG